MVFGDGAGFSGEAAPTGAASPRASCGSSGPGAALEFSVFAAGSALAADLAGGSWSSSRSSSFSGVGDDGGRGKEVCWDRGALARVVHRRKLRRDAADGHGGVSHRAKLSLTAARRRLAILVSGDGDVEDLGASGSFSSTYVVSVFVLCTMYVVFV